MPIPYSRQRGKKAEPRKFKRWCKMPSFIFIIKIPPRTFFRAWLSSAKDPMPFPSKQGTNHGPQATNFPISPPRPSPLITYCEIIKIQLDRIFGFAILCCQEAQSPLGSRLCAVRLHQPLLQGGVIHDLRIPAVALHISVTFLLERKSLLNCKRNSLRDCLLSS